MMYHLRATFATTRRIIQQLLHDKRTIAIMFVAPILLISLLWWMFSDNETMFDSFGPALIGIFPFTVMFLIASITTLRERVTGTMERLLAMPIGKFDIIMGYAVAFGLFGAVQSLLTSSWSTVVFCTGRARVHTARRRARAACQRFCGDRVPSDSVYAPVYFSADYRLRAVRTT